MDYKRFFRGGVVGFSFLLTALMPVFLWLFLRQEQYIGASLVLLGVLVVRALAAWLRGAFKRDLLWTTVLGVGLCLICLGVRDSLGSRFLLLYPVIINVSLLLVFGQSLRLKVSVVERFASLKVPPEKRDHSFKRYCRKVTLAWVIFFIINGSLALATVLIGDPALWALYNGFISYILLGLMFAGEYLIRLRVIPK